MKIKTFFFYIITMVISVSSFCQEVNQRNDNNSVTIERYGPHEVGLRFSGLTDFNFIYKKKLKGGSYLRFSVLNLIFNLDKDENENRKRDIDIGIRGGLERRILLKNKVYLIQGAGLGLSYSYFLNETLSNGITVTNEVYSTSLSYIAGIHYEISKRFYLNGELIPSFVIDHNVFKNENTAGKKESTTDVFLGLSSNFFILTFGCKI